MKVTGFLLAAFLILFGVLGFARGPVAVEIVVLDILAIAAGACLFVDTIKKPGRP